MGANAEECFGLSNLNEPNKVKCICGVTMYSRLPKF